MEAQRWQHLSLGDLYRVGIAKFRQTRRRLKTYSPVKLDLTAARNLWGVVSPRLIAPFLYVLEGLKEHQRLPQAGEREEGAPHPLLSPAPPTRHKPWHRRTERVNLALLQAWGLGFHTYSQLIEQVRLQTGRGCSKRAIARFIKKSREML
jgi:hypothetical protein